MLKDLSNPEHLKHGLCTVVVVGLLSYLLPNLLPYDENSDDTSFLGKVRKVLSSVKSNPLPILVIVFVSCVLGGALCKNMPAKIPGVSGVGAPAPAAE